MKEKAEKAVELTVEWINFCSDGYYGDCGEVTINILLKYLFDNNFLNIKLHEKITDKSMEKHFLKEINSGTKTKEK